MSYRFAAVSIAQPAGLRQQKNVVGLNRKHGGGRAVLHEARQDEFNGETDLLALMPLQPVESPAIRASKQAASRRTVLRRKVLQ
jgi:hypothetical protein